MPARALSSVPKYRRLIDNLEAAVVSGKYKPGQKLPSEAALVERFHTSRITVGRALRELQQKGLIERRAGSGSYVRPPKREAGGSVFGLLIPDLGQTEIFEPICQGMTRAPEAADHALLWGNTAADSLPKDEQAWQLCRQYIERKVAGVFFAPVELSPGKDAMNRRIILALEEARIPIVLLDRPVIPHPGRRPYDLVGIDNRRAGQMITEHLLTLGCRRIAFIAYPNSASTVEARIAGYREALLAFGVAPKPGMIRRINPDSLTEVRAAMEATRAEAVVCANDRTAGYLMRAVLKLDYRVPRDLRIAGIDDVEYARLLPVPLTTIRQPCREIGEVAMAAMVERISRNDMPSREILLACTLVVRDSA